MYTFYMYVLWLVISDDVLQWKKVTNYEIIVNPNLDADISLAATGSSIDFLAERHVACFVFGSFVKYVTMYSWVTL